MDITKKSCREFVEVLASSEPTPGGGGAAALIGAIGVALGNMVGSLTVGKKKYATVENDILRLKTLAKSLQNDFLNLVEKDADAFRPLAKAYSMPAGEEKNQVMEKCLKMACAVPMEIMEKCCQAIEMEQEFAEKGSKIAISDAAVGATACRAGLQGASFNVFINTGSMKDRDFAEEQNHKAQDMLDKYMVMADEICNRVRERL